jgi:ABC-type iron transport system FetAB ATPase subunit
MPDALEAREVEVRFGRQEVLRRFSISVKPGGKAVLTGPSGCGKSTVLRCFLGFVVPDAGAVCIKGTPLTAETVWDLRRHLAYIAQEPDLGTGTTAEILERPFHFRANAGLRRNLKRIGELFERFNLPRELLSKDVTALSGGEKQRVALVSAVLLDRDIFLLDEVTSALDKTSRKVVADYFRMREDTTVLCVAHDQDVFSFADQIIELSGGSTAKETA